MLAVIKRFADDNFVFQQDNAPVHLAFNTVLLVQWKSILTSFLPSCVPNSP